MITPTADDYALQARLLGKTYSPDSVNQHARYPALEVGINGAHQFTTASISGRLNVRQGMDAMGADIVSAPCPILILRSRKAIWTQRLFADKWRLSTSRGDWSNNTLPEPERVSFGAQRFGRGYRDSEASGDYGYGGQVELRYIQMRKESTGLPQSSPTSRPIPRKPV